MKVAVLNFTIYSEHEDVTEEQRDKINDIILEAVESMELFIGGSITLEDDDDL
jgi:hypothetical protein